jgi:hypothetical protein
VARHTEIDSWEKHGRKGYFFMIGDEMAYPFVKRNEVNSHINDGLERDIPVAEIVRELQQRYHVFYILPKAASYGGNPEILKFWRALLGQNVLELDETAAVCETIALTIGMMEGTIDLTTGMADLKEFGKTDTTVKAVTNALAKVPTGLMKVKSKGGVLSGLKR